MSALILDTGALVAVDRGDRAMAARLRVAERSGLGLCSTGAVIAEVWRDAAGRQANLARLLKSVDVRAVDRQLGKEAGVLLGKSGVNDAVDATVVAVAGTGDRVLTSDPADIQKLVSASRRAILVVPC
jgi:predicted nucleic acid-binding protein